MKMKKHGFTALAGLLAVLLIGLVPAISQDGEDGEKPGESLEEAWMKLTQPGPQHESLAKDAGKWSITQRFWVEGMDEPMEVQGESTIEMRWDRYLYEEMSIGEDRVNAVGYVGYDNSAGEYTSCYFGIMGTGMVVYRGKASEDGKTVTLTNTRVEKGLGNMKISERYVVTRKSDDEKLIEMYAKYGDKPESKVGELVYKRKK